MNNKRYYEAVPKSGLFGWKVYRFDETGNHEVIIAKSDRNYSTEGEAHDAACEWMEENGVDAELV